ncbi:ECF transporter S component [Zhaonella formicivorans]|uniref:ECF transporter S component n=1 Tax=Zhaonella formicivorans TaxID=2528593 RepID=UPI0010DD591A|nr:ECF transporter S component [Zhaonella formicivorans]
MKTRELVLGGLLTSLALLIPLAFGGFLGVLIPPFSATLASHVPLMLAMTISPAVAIIVALGSTLGFLIKLGPIIAARAFMHVFVGYTGATLIKQGKPLYLVLLLVLPIHALGEALIVIPFGFSLYNAGVVVGLGTAFHHLADSFITLAVVKQLGLLRKSLPAFSKKIS